MPAHPSHSTGPVGKHFLQFEPHPRISFQTHIVCALFWVTTLKMTGIQNLFLSYIRLDSAGCKIIPFVFTPLMSTDFRSSWNGQYSRPTILWDSAKTAGSPLNAAETRWVDKIFVNLVFANVVNHSGMRSFAFRRIQPKTLGDLELVRIEKFRNLVLIHHVFYNHLITSMVIGLLRY